MADMTEFDLDNDTMTDLHFRVPQNTKQRLTDLAKCHGRTLTAVIDLLIRQAWDQKFKSGDKKRG